MKLTFKSSVNANGITGIVITRFRISMAIKTLSLAWFDAGYNFNETK